MGIDKERPGWATAPVRFATLVFAAFAVCCALSGLAKTNDPPWIAKDWIKWNSDDCDTVLNHSPWGQGVSSKGFGNTTLEFNAQVRSALPIREAVLRKLQLDKDYGKMKRGKKQAFEEAHLHDLDPSDQVLIYIENITSTAAPSAGTVTHVYEVQAPVATQAGLRLSDGTLVLPTQTNQIRDSSHAANAFETQFEYVFPREVAGKPLYTSDDSFLTIELGAPLVLDKKSHQPVAQEFRLSGKRYAFKIADMMYKGKLEY